MDRFDYRNLVLDRPIEDLHMVILIMADLRNGYKAVYSSFEIWLVIVIKSCIYKAGSFVVGLRIGSG